MLLVLMLAGSAGWAKTLVVTRTADAGKGTLRWAIERANTRPSADMIIFDPGISGQRIRPLTQLPSLVDSETTIDGDIDDDGDPDIELSGIRAGSADGLMLAAHPRKKGCIIRGLSITEWGKNGIYIYKSNRNTVIGCHLGVKLDGSTGERNGFNDIYIREGRNNLVGGTTAMDRNIIAGARSSGGISLQFTSEKNRVIGNYLGIRRNGTDTIANVTKGTGIAIELNSSENLIGGPTAGERNVIGGFDRGMVISGSLTEKNVVAGNYIGLLPNGEGVARMGAVCISLRGAAHHNTIGGSTAGHRNVFSGPDQGVTFQSNLTQDNTVKGNYFGLNAAGNALRRMGTCLLIYNGADKQVIGGSPTSGRNYICPNGGAAKLTAIEVKSGCGIDSLIRGNRIGIRPDGVLCSKYDFGLELNGAVLDVLDNRIYRAGTGVLATGSGANPTVMRNRFKRCEWAVRLEGGANCVLGDVGSVGAGNNDFRPNNTWAIWNNTASNVKAEGNSFGTGSIAAIDAKIWDKKDDGALGQVDYSPLRGGVVPSGGTVGVAGLVAVPTAVGAEVAFTLTAAAAVEARVLNLAGRPVGTICRARPSDAGANTLVWNGRSEAGLRAPAGRYLVEVTARTPDGSQARAVASVTLGR